MGEARIILARDAALAVGYIPHLLSALIIVVVGCVIAWVTGRLCALFLSRVGVDAIGERTGLTEDLATVGFRMPVSKLIGAMAFWIVFVATIVQAIDTLGLAPISGALNSLLLFLPHVVLATVIAIGGIVVGDILARNAAGRMSRAGILYHPLAGMAIRAAVIVIALLMALQQLTIESSFLVYVLLVMLAGVALAGGIAVGWGARTLAENLVAGRYVESQFARGQTIRLNGTKGKIERLNPANIVVVGDEGQRIVLPNALLSRSAVETDSPSAED